MTYRLESPPFLAWVAFCSAVAVALAVGLTSHDSTAARVAAGLIGVVVGPAFALFSFLLAATVRRTPSEAAVHAFPPAPAPATAPPAAAPALSPAPATPPATSPAWREIERDDLRDRLEARLAAGRELRGEAPGPAVEEWIETTRRMLQDGAPGAARYFAALGPSSWPAHLERLETVLRDFI